LLTANPLPPPERLLGFFPINFSTSIGSAIRQEYHKAIVVKLTCPSRSDLSVTWIKDAYLTSFAESTNHFKIGLAME
jgi:hypothetical protein